jgi:hypothetical protein
MSPVFQVFIGFLGAALKDRSIDSGVILVEQAIASSPRAEL